MNDTHDMIRLCPSSLAHTTSLPPLAPHLILLRYFCISTNTHDCYVESTPKLLAETRKRFVHCTYQRYIWRTGQHTKQNKRRRSTPLGWLATAVWRASIHDERSNMPFALHSRDPAQHGARLHSCLILILAPKRVMRATIAFCVVFFLQEF